MASDGDLPERIRVSVTPEGEARVEMQVQNTLWSACAAYAAVLARWRDAKPRSLSLETARGRSKALACAAP